MSGLAASPLGLLIGLLMGAFGGGGSLLAIPILVYLVDQSPREAQAATLVIVMAAAVAGVVTHLRTGNVRWRAGLALGLATGVTSYAASRLSSGLDPDLLLLAFSPLMLAGAVAMLGDRGEREPSFEPWRDGVRPGQALRMIAIGVGVGSVIGVFGVGGGFVLVPVLVLALGFSMVAAAGTSLLVVTIGSGFALVDRLGADEVDWSVAGPFAIAALAGALAGRGLAERASAASLRWSFAAVLAAAALFTAADSLAGL